MRALANRMKAFMVQDEGLEQVEYAVMTALIVAALVTAITLLSGAIAARFDAVRGVIEGIV